MKNKIQIKFNLKNIKENEAYDSLVICAGVNSKKLAYLLGDRINIYPVKGYSITVMLNDKKSQISAPSVSILDDGAK